MVIETNKKAKNRKKSVLLFSGGMDCVCLNQIYKPDILLHINYGGIYSEAEKISIKKLIKCKAIDSKKLIELDIGRGLSFFERDDLIIPNRNSIFINLAANYGEVIWLASVKGDRSFDKDNEFFRIQTKLLNHMNNEQHWTEKRIFKVYSPIKKLTKVELIKKFLKSGGRKEWLLESYSCYSGNKKACGLCKPCLRKAVALFKSDINIPKDYFQTDPRKNLEILKLKNEIINGNYRKDEDKDICKYMGWRYIGK
ncbi:MAG: 7-cyano-7-deazaguanine synthase [Promethearchaeia archaeon]